MIKGIKALFTSGAIFNPFVLLGIIFGFYVALASDKGFVELLLKQPSFYCLVVFFSIIFHFTLKKVYKEGGYVLDIAKMAWNIIVSCLVFFFSAAMSFIFVLIFLFF